MGGRRVVSAYRPELAAEHGTSSASPDSDFVDDDVMYQTPMNLLQPMEEELLIAEAALANIDAPAHQKRSPAIQAALARLRGRLQDAIHQIKEGRTTRAVRKKLTGDEETCIRHWAKGRVQEVIYRPRVIMALDQGSFLFGVLMLVLAEGVLLRQQPYFRLFYLIVMPSLIAIKYVYYRSKNWHFFLCDFCYFVNLLTIVHVLFAAPLWPLISQEAEFMSKLRALGWSIVEPLFRHKESLSVQSVCRLHKMCFAYAFGPLAWAVWVFKNSFVFHDPDKISSTYLHILPGFLLYTMRNPDNGFGSHDALSPTSCAGYDSWDLFFCTFGYAFWQVGYLLLTEGLFKDRLDRDSSIQTSLRHLVTDKRNFMHLLVKTACVRMRILSPEESFSIHERKTKIVFVIAQALYTWVLCLPVPLLYHSSTAQLTFMCLDFVCAAFLGGRYYIEVFSTRYVQKIEERTRKLARIRGVDASTSAKPDRDVVMRLEATVAAQSAELAELRDQCTRLKRLTLEPSGALHTASPSLSR